MGYREVVMSQNPLSFWPLDDDVSTGIVKEATGRGNDGAYAGSIFDEAIPLISNGLYGTRLKDSTAQVYFPCPGATGSGTSWSNGGMFSSGKENQPFSIELYFKLEEDNTYLNEELVLFGNTTIIQTSEAAPVATYTDIIQNYETYQELLEEFQTYDSILNASILAPYGIYAYKNKIYFRPEPEINYYVSVQVPDWKQRYHVVANYSTSGISLVVNGDLYSAKSVTDITVPFEFRRSNPVFKTIGSDNYPLTIDGAAIYPYVIERQYALSHYQLSRSSISASNYYNANNQLYYMPNNNECLFVSRFYNNWGDFSFTNAVLNSKNEMTLRYISDQNISGGGTAVFNNIDGRSCLDLQTGQYLDISNIMALSTGGNAISVSFHHSSLETPKGIFYSENTSSAQSVGVFVNSTNHVVINYNGIEESTEISPINGWNEILLENRTGDLRIYLNGSEVYSVPDYISEMSVCYVGRYESYYADCPITWVAVKSNIQNVTIVNHTLYNQAANFTLKFNNNLNWSQYGVSEGFLFVPGATTGGSLGYYTSGSQNVSVTYNGLSWPMWSGFPGVLAGQAPTVTDFNVKIELWTDDSEDDLPILNELGFYIYAPDMKRVASENNPDLAEIVNIDQATIYDYNAQVLDRFDQAGIRLAGTSYLRIPSQAKHFDEGGFNGTKSISMLIKINEPLSVNKYILSGGGKSLYFDGTQWQHTGFNKMYVNGVESFTNEHMVNDWVHIVLTSTSKIDAGTNIYVGSNGSGANQTDINVGVFSMAAYILDAADVENEYEMLTGRPQESIATDQVSFSIVDYGATPYRFALQTI